MIGKRRLELHPCNSSLVFEHVGDLPFRPTPAEVTRALPANVSRRINGGCAGGDGYGVAGGVIRAPSSLGSHAFVITALTHPLKTWTRSA